MSYKLKEGNLKFRASGKDILSALQKINAVTTYVKSEDSKFILCSDGKRCFVLGTSTDATALIEVDATVESAGLARIDYTTFTGLIKGRQDLNFEQLEGKLHFSEVKGRFKAHLNTMLFDADDIHMVQTFITPPQTKSLDKATVEAIFSAVSDVALTDFYTNTELPVLFDIREKVMYTYCFDQYHIAYRKAKGTGVKLKLAMTAKAFTVIKKFADSEMTFDKADGRLVVGGTGFVISIPETQVEEDYYNMVPIYISALDESEPIAEITFEKGAAKTIDNMYALTDKDTKMHIHLDKIVKLSVTTAGGHVSDEFKTNLLGKPVKMSVDPRIFMDLFRKGGETCPLSAYDIKGAASAFVMQIKNTNFRLTLIGTYDGRGDK